MGMSTRGLMFFNLETWLEFQGMQAGSSKDMSEISWGNMSNDIEIRRLYDAMGEVYLGLPIKMLQRYMSEDSIAAILQDWCSLRASQDMHVSRRSAHIDPIGKAACPMTPTLSEQSEYRSPSPPSFRGTPSPQPEGPGVKGGGGASRSPALDPQSPARQDSVGPRGLLLDDDSESKDDLQRTTKRKHRMMSSRPCWPSRTDLEC